MAVKPMAAVISATMAVFEIVFMGQVLCMGPVCPAWM
jgi:hypothetical protein